VYFDTIETRGHGIVCGLAEGLDDGRDLVEVQGALGRQSINQ
jgi:hypothetical protein